MSDSDSSVRKQEKLDRRKWSQFLTAFLCSMSAIAIGLQAGWLPCLRIPLQSEDSPLGKNSPPLSDEEISWIETLPSISLILGSPVFGYLMDKFGRKKSLLVAIAPNLLTYLLLTLANNVYMIYIARFIGGFCSAGGFSVASIYISETCESKLRGLLCGLIGAFINLGIIITFLLGGYTSYLVLNLTSLMIPVLFLLSYFWIPESPVFLMLKNRKEDAIKALIKLKGNDYTLIEREINRIQNIINEAKQKEGKFSLKTFFTSKTSVKAMMIVYGVFTIQMFSGYPVVISYTFNIILKSGADSLGYLAVILVLVTQFLSAVISASIIDKVGRKKITSFSTFVMGLSLCLLSLYLFTKSNDNLGNVAVVFRLLPAICLIAFISAYSAAYGTVPFLLVPELFSPETRATACVMANVLVSTLEFFVSKIFPTVSYWIGVEGSFLIFASICGLGVVFISLVMFETKGLESEDVYQKLGGNIEHVLKPFEEKGVSDLDLARLNE